MGRRACSDGSLCCSMVRLFCDVEYCAVWKAGLRTGSNRAVPAKAFEKVTVTDDVLSQLIKGGRISTLDSVLPDAWRHSRSTKSLLNRIEEEQLCKRRIQTGRVGAGGIFAACRCAPAKQSIKSSSRKLPPENSIGCGCAPASAIKQSPQPAGYEVKDLKALRIRQVDAGQGACRKNGLNPALRNQKSRKQGASEMSANADEETFDRSFPSRAS